MIPSPAGCLAITETSPAPEIVYVMLVSSPLCEKTQISEAVAPLGGRISSKGFPARVQELFEVLNEPRAATFKSTSLFVCETPAVVGSTTTMSLLVAFGAPSVNEITSLVPSSETTTKETAFDFVPSGF